MLRQFTAEEMLTLWKREKGLLPSPSLLAIEDSTEIDKLLIEEIDVWYERQLNSAPVQYIPVEDIASGSAAHWVTINEARIIPSVRMVRPLRLRMAAWQYDVHDFPPLCRQIEERERYAATASTPLMPNACMLPDRLIAAYGLLPAIPPDALFFPPYRRDGQTPPGIIEFTCVVRPPQGTYIFDPVLLSSIHTNY